MSTARHRRRRGRHAMNAPRPRSGQPEHAAYEQPLRDSVRTQRHCSVPARCGESAQLGANKAVAAGLPQLRDDLWRYADLRSWLPPRSVRRAGGARICSLPLARRC